MNLAIAAFFRIGELEARVFLSDGEMAEWCFANAHRLDWGHAWELCPVAGSK